MEIKTNINRNLGDTGISINSGAIIIVDNIIEKFIQNEEQLKQQSLLDLQDIEIIKSKKATYEIDYINKYDKYKNLYNAKITITNGNSFYTKLNLFQKLKIKYMLKECWLQKGSNIAVVITILLTVISIIISYLNYIK